MSRFIISFLFILFFAFNSKAQYKDTILLMNGNYVVETNKKGYVITNKKTKEVVKLNFNESEKSWSVESKGQSVTFMTFVDEDHVKMYNPNGEATIVELSKAGVMAYQQIVNNNMAFACN